jgi:hypothetical protein
MTGVGEPQGSNEARNEKDVKITARERSTDALPAHVPKIIGAIMQRKKMLTSSDMVSGGAMLMAVVMAARWGRATRTPTPHTRTPTTQQRGEERRGTRDKAMRSLRKVVARERENI